MAESFKAAVLVSPNSPLEIMDLKIPELRDGQVLIRVISAGVCRSQLMEVTGKRGQDEWLPHLLGHEGFGVVEAVGPLVSKVSIGERVIVGWIVGTGINASPPQFFTETGFQVNSGVATTFSEYSVVSENRIYAAPKGFSEDFLPLFGCSLLTGGGMVFKYFNESIHKKVLILGFGGVGSSAAVVLDSLSKTEIVIIDESEPRLNQARKMGFKNVHTLSEFKSTFKENSTNKFDLCIESAGSSSTIEQGFSLLNKTGTLIFASHPESGSKIALDPFELISGKTIFGSFGGESIPEKDISKISELLLESTLNLEYMLGSVSALEDVNLALNQLELGLPGRPIIRMYRT
jgi:S-(hydroxymethyl)glutathione dehydrogenase/alcohol dehydrogenase